MKYIILIFAISQIGCTNNNKTSFKQEENTKKIDTCEFKINSFNFKGFEIGMNLKQIKNLLTLKKHNNIIYGEVKHPENYTIFNKRVSKLKIEFFNEKLYSIFIETKTDFYSDVVKKFNLQQCSEGYINILRVENEKMYLYYDADYYRPKKPIYFLWVTGKDFSPKAIDIFKEPLQFKEPNHIIDEEDKRLSDF